MICEQLDITITVRSRVELSHRDQEYLVNRVRRMLRTLPAIAEIEFYQEPFQLRVVTPHDH